MVSMEIMLILIQLLTTVNMLYCHRIQDAANMYYCCHG